MSVRVILVEPKREENIGAVARVMKNFGFSELYLVRPRKLGRKAFVVASHAADVLERCDIASTLEEALSGSDVAVGTTAKLATTERRHLRNFLTPKELKNVCVGKVSIIFGREDIGLLNEELKLCDVVVHIPTDKRYSVMNVSHAAAVILYELSLAAKSQRKMERVMRRRPASFEERAQFYEHFLRFLDSIQYAEHKKERTLLIVKRILGRAAVTSRELRALRGVLRKAIWCLSSEPNASEH